MARENSAKGRKAATGRPPRDGSPPSADRSESSLERRFEAKVARVEQALEEKAAKVEQALEKKAARLEADAEEAARRAAKHDRLTRGIGTLDVWLRAAPGTRKPRFTRDEIAAAAVKIADEGGLAALSMRNLASALDAGTMTLYHYVRTKDELLSLVNDAVMGEIVVPPSMPLPDAWRDAVVLLAERSRDALLRHPWILDITDDPPFGPNAVRHFDQSLQATAGLDVPLEDRLDVVLAVDEYVFGYCLHARNHPADDDEVHDDLDEDMMGYVNQLVGEGGFRAVDELVDEMGYEGVWQSIFAHHRDPDRFSRNLLRLLDGFEPAFRERRGRARRRPAR